MTILYNIKLWSGIVLVCIILPWKDTMTKAIHLTGIIAHSFRGLVSYYHSGEHSRFQADKVLAREVADILICRHQEETALAWTFRTWKFILVTHSCIIATPPNPSITFKQLHSLVLLVNIMIVWVSFKFSLLMACPEWINLFYCNSY